MLQKKIVVFLQVSPPWNLFPTIEIWLAGPVCMGEVGSQVRIQRKLSRLITMQNINLIAQGIPELSHCEVHDNNNNNDDDDNII